eukprot:TRINITY_DN6963_c0_g1_i1.p1 TRINITY_DN6963_c0_g1~~TRINITY_DN6963_c0_g1_i1.p1  ORF type:complete len:149 (-),score=48.45 TRINITY_DN6963_c0_g1_i1:160-561(-)
MTPGQAYRTLRSEWKENLIIKDPIVPPFIVRKKEELRLWISNHVSVDVADFLFWFSVENYLGLVMWLLLFFVFVRLEFGIVFFICSVFFFIFYNLGSRNKGEMSAYSVFNRGAKALPGQLTAAQFEAELLHKY